MLKVTVMQTETARQLPHSFNGVQFGTLRWKEVQIKAASLLLPPGLVDSRMMIGSVVRNDHHTSTGAQTGLAQLLEELKEPVAIEFLGFWAKHKASIAETYRPQNSTLISGGIHMRQREPCC
jgi:hypothetical protein